MEEFFAPAARHFPEFTRFEVEGFVEAFQAFDKGTGKIPASELRELMTFMGQNPREEDLEIFKKQQDLEKKGGMNWLTFLALVRYSDPMKCLQFAYDWIEPALDHFPEFNHEELLKFVEVFRLFDDDSSGRISVKELVHIFETHGDKLDRDGACEMFRLVGADPDNDELSWRQYLELMRLLNPLKLMAYRQKWFEPVRKFPEWSRAEIEVFIHAFRQFDLDDSGTIDRDELEFALEQMGQGTTPERVNELISKFGNKSGVIEWPSFLEMMGSFYPDQKTQFVKSFLEPAKKYTQIFSQDDIDALIEIFQEFDDDADRALSTKQLKRILFNMGQGCSDEKMVEIMKEFDTDKSGTIDFGEFLAIISSFYQDRTPKKQQPPPTQQTKAAPPPVVTVTPTPTPAPTTAKTAPAPARSPSPAKGSTTATTTTTTTPARSPSPAKGGSRIGNSATPSSNVGGPHQCPGCGKTVFAAEKATGCNNEWFHKLCFKCAKCTILLTAGNYHDHDGKMYCKKCHQQHFANSGYGPGRVGSFQS